MSNFLSTTSDNIQVQELTTNTFSFWELFSHAELVVQIIMIGLILASIWSWTIIIDKMITFYKVKYQMRKFIEFFNRTKSINQLLKYAIDNNEKHPLAKLLIFSIEEWQFKPKNELNKNTIDNIKERVVQSMEIGISKSINILESNINYLATVASSGPFIGLFGTVWGIMTSFQSIASAKNTSLAVVAPGIAEALLATGIGLVAAIPAAIFYNKFSSDIDLICKDTEEFKKELLNLMLRELS